LIERRLIGAKGAHRTSYLGMIRLQAPGIRRERDAAVRKLRLLSYPPDLEELLR
jgi:hypothetical protein